jgi:hypothetical protein
MKTLIVNNIEGGYYHPDMKMDGRMKDPSNLYKSSGETMFGIDRKAGAGLATGNPAAWNKFWKLIDDAGARHKWRWNYFGGPLEYELKKLSLEIIRPWFETYPKKYLKPETIAVIKTDPRLVFHFFYATYNGPKWFQGFADKMNKRIAAGIRDTNFLVNQAIQDRKNASSKIIWDKANLVGKMMGQLIGKQATPVEPPKKKFINAFRVFDPVSWIRTNPFFNRTNN